MTEPAVFFMVAMHLLTAVAVVCYTSDTRTRPGSTLIGVAIAGASVAGAISAIRDFETGAADFDLWLLVLVSAVAVSAVLNGGNVARLFRRPRGR